MSLLTKDEILKAQDLSFDEVEVPEWGNKKVRIKVMTGTERDAYEKESLSFKGDKVETKIEHARANLLIKTICDENNKRLFEDNEIDLLESKSSLVLDRLFVIALRVNGIGKDEVEELVKNS